MRFKQIISASIALMMAVGTTVSAQNDFEVSLQGNKVTISGNVDTSVKRISLKVLPQEASESSIADIYGMAEAEVKDGFFEYSFLMPDKFNGNVVDGIFSVYVSGNDKLKSSFGYISSDKREAFAASLNTENMRAIFDDSDNEKYFDSLGADISYYKTLSPDEKDSFIAFLKNEKGESTITVENISELVKIASVLQKAKTNVDENLIAESGVGFENVKFEDETDAEKKAWLVQYADSKKPYESYEQLESAYKDGNILYLLQKAKYSDYEDLIDKYDDRIKIKDTTYYAQYSNMSETNKNAVNEAIKKSGVNFTSYELFLNQFESAVKDIVAKNGKGNSNNSGGTGGGGGSNSGKKKPSQTVIPISVTEKITRQENKKAFSDVDKDHWANEAIQCLFDKEIVSGYEDDTFKPNNQITREEFIKMIVSALDIDTTNIKSEFTDVDRDKWYTSYIDAAFGKKLISGREDGSFGIGEKITREEMCVIVRRAINTLTKVRTYTEFDDEMDISEYAREAVADLYSAGIVNGISAKEFSPKSVVTRAQAAKIIYDAFIK